MNDGLKQRLVGAVVLLALAVIFLPSLLRDQQPQPVDIRTQIPEPADIEPMTFGVPEQRADVEPAPNPETMFVPEESEQPVVDELGDAQGPEPEAASEPTKPEVAVENEPTAEPDPAGGEGAWVVQVASFTSAEAANGLRDQLQDQGYKAYVRSAEISSGEVSRVYIGPKLDRGAARDIKSEVDREWRVDALVLRFQP